MKFIPTAAQAFNGTLTFVRANGATITVALSGTGADAGTGTQPPSGPYTIWPSTAVPAVIDQGPDLSVELGVTFRADTNGYITGIRFYKSNGNTGTHVGNLWSNTGTLLATALFTAESASGWQQVNFANPVAIAANTAYVASYHASTGHYSINEDAFTTSGVDSTPLHVMANGNGTANGPYAYGNTSAFPTNTYKSTNYWVDVVFDNTINPTPVAPSITTQPASRTVTAGQTAALSITATGTASLGYQWRKNGAALSGATSSSYTTPATATSDSGAQFTVVVSNSAGSVTSSAAILTVTAANVAPSITTQPANRTVTAGQTAAFSVTATGTAPFTYQWSKSGAPISGAASSGYTTPATATSDSGAQFTVVVSNSAGSVTSSAATLTVNAGTLLLTMNPASLSFGNVNLTTTKTQSVTLTNSGTANVTISGISYSGPGFSASGMSSGQILTPGQAGTLNVAFAPSAAGSVTGSVAVTSNATNSPGTASLSGSGVQPVTHSTLLSWTRSTSTVVGYQVYSSTVSGGPYAKRTTSLATTPSYTDSTVQSGNTYYYVVTAVDSSAVESVFSAQTSALIP
jgi:hypothetical protein